MRVLADRRAPLANPQAWIFAWVVLLGSASVSALMQDVPDVLRHATWRVPIAGWGRPEATPDKVYVLTREHSLIALDRASGTRSWTRPLSSMGYGMAGWRVVVEGSAVIAADYNLFAFDRESGRPLWEFAPSVGYGPGYYLGAAARGVVFAGSPAGRLYAVDAETGEQRWSHEVVGAGAVTVYAPVESAGLVFATYTKFGPPDRGGIVALRADDGQLAWDFVFPLTVDTAFPTSAAGGVAVADDLAIASSADGRIWAVSAKTGSVQWQGGPVRADGPGPTRDYRSLAVAADTLVAAATDGTLVGLSVRTGERRWRREGNFDSPSFHLSSGFGLVAIPYNSGALVLLDAADGRVLWALPWAAGLSWAPLVANDHLFAAGQSAVYALPVRVP
jgi:outer membrane protein assembly factor BamB